MGAAEIFAVDSDANRLNIARDFGATVTLLSDEKPTERIVELTHGKGVKVAIEALGQQITSRTRCEYLLPAELYPAWASIRVICRCRWKEFMPALVIK